MKPINDIYRDALIDIYTNGSIIKPRGMEVREIEAYKFEPINPEDNIITLDNFKTNLNYANEELNWYLSGNRDINHSRLIEKIWSKYSDDGKTVNSNYGERMYGKHKIIKNNQWNQVKKELINDPDSRRALININSYFDKNNPKSNDVPCTIALQYFIRDNKLDMITYMRSNDLFLGFRNDMFCFTEFQKIMADELNIDAGIYHHVAGSAHIYKKDYSKIEELVNETQ